jgi:glutamate-1-semialdehyde aminotransferase
MNKGIQLYKQAKNCILGGTMLFSKRPELWLPEHWPSYFSRAKNINVWDLEGKKYTDMICAVGQSILGYANSEIDNEVCSYIKKGNMTTLNCPEEVILSKKLIKMHPWSGMAKFARSGGEANAIAIRIARSAAKKDKIAICGYHGWHDWYLSANLKKNNLKKHLLPGLLPIGVPKILKNTVYTFNYNDFEALDKIVRKNDIGVIKMEVARGSLPNIDFLKNVRRLANKKKIILIFDECTSGFRHNFGGLHLITGVEPDMAMFGKALGNGFAITAVLGRKKIMDAAAKSFISSTFWTERIGYIAANATLNIMEREKTWKKLLDSGQFLNKEWKKLSDKYNLNLKISGLEAITSFSFKDELNLYLKTFVTQEMLKMNYLAGNLVYITVHHSKKIISEYINSLDKIFKKIYKINSVSQIKNLLKGPVCHSSFKRLVD